MEEVEIREKKRGHGFAIFLLCIAFLLIGAGLMYYYLTVYSNNTKGQENTTESVDNKDMESLNVNGSLVQELIKRLDNYGFLCGVNAELYKNSKTTVDNLDENYMKILVAQEANGKNISGNITFSKEDFENATKNIFGETIVLTNTDINSCPGIKYDVDNQKYIMGDANCGSTCGPVTNVRYIVNAEKNSENLYITVAVASVNSQSLKVSNINDPDSVIEGIDGNTFDIEKDYQKVNNYKYTFDYDVANNNYVFNSIELVKNEN